jgi:hypothetical protein
MALTSTAPTSCPYAINRRYIHTEYGLPLTVKYIGPLPPTSTQVSEGSSSNPTTWIGVEWDDPTRGKHSGAYQDLQVFRTRIPGSASFLKFKPTKRARTTGEGSAGLKGMLDEGKGFFQAVYERYIDSQLDTDAHHGNTPTNQTQSSAVGKVVLGSSNGQITVEMPNLDKVVRKLRKGVDDTLSDNGHASLDVKEIGLEGQWVYGVESERDDTASQAGMQESRWQTLRGKLNSKEFISVNIPLLCSFECYRCPYAQPIPQLNTALDRLGRDLCGTTELASPGRQVSVFSIPLRSLCPGCISDSMPYIHTCCHCTY